MDSLQVLVADEHDVPVAVRLDGPRGRDRAQRAGWRGKSTLAHAVRAALPGRAAAIDTDMFNWQCVPGESNKNVVYENIVSLVANYLRHGYHVVLSGLIITDEERGAMDVLRSLARWHGVPYVDFYCAVPLEVAVERSTRRAKDVPVESIRTWWALAESDRAKVRWPLQELDMLRPVDVNATIVVELLEDFPS